CLIPLVELRTRVIFLRSPVAAVPCEERRWSSRRALSLSVSESSAEALLTPAGRRRSSSAAGGRLSSAASWATVVDAIGVLILAWSSLAAFRRRQLVSPPFLSLR